MLADMVAVRSPDDTILGFEHHADVERFPADLRWQKAGLRWNCIPKRPG
jgi:hypothetical protein